MTLFDVMQATIGDGLKARYEPPQKLSHELFVLMMQLNELERSAKPARVSARPLVEAS